MKQLFSLFFVLLTGIGSIYACRKAPVAERTTPCTILVMDTTQALLFDAEIKVGKSVIHTSFDGRIVLKPGQLAGVKKLFVSCEGYESKQLTMKEIETANDPLLVVLTPTKSKARKEKGLTLGGASRGKGMVLYSMPDAEVAMTPDYLATGDFAVMDEFREMDMSSYSAVSNGVSAGKLTAGEVNDFARWAFWQKVIDSTHQRFVSEWCIEPRHRYTVQVVNEQGYPVVNYPVTLSDQNGNTVFQAMTDNTGKAELWNGLFGPAVPVKEPQKILVVDEPCDAPSQVDVVFIFDATGSMGDELRYLQAEMKDVIARATDATGGLAIRTGAVVYRDHQDDYLTRISRLTGDLSVTQAFIDKQEAGGGGDYEEAVPEALMAALNSAGWDTEARARVAFLILDAPCHQDSATLALLHDQILNAAAQGIRLVPVVCSGIAESGEYLLRAMALVTNGTSFFLTDDSGIGNTHLCPTTDSLAVEHLNDMLVRTIVEFSYMPECEQPVLENNLSEDFVPNPFEAADLEVDPAIPHGEGVLYVLDVSGKLITVTEGEISALHLPIGIYFIKTFYNGEWHTRKVILR